MTAGYVYILINPSIPDSIKIGYTTRSSEDRASELSRPSSVPTPFEVAYDILVSDCETVEDRLHNKFADYRVSRGREFFRISLKDAIKALEEIANKFKINVEQQSESGRAFEEYEKEIGLLWGTPSSFYGDMPRVSEIIEFEGKFIVEAEERYNKLYTKYELYLLPNGRYVVYRFSNHNLGDWGDAYLAGANAWGEKDPPLTLIELQERYPVVAKSAGLTRVRKFKPDEN